MKILHTSDWHLGKSLYDYSLLEDQQYALSELLQVILRERVDAVVLAGDIYDRPVPSAEAVQLYDHFLTETVAKLGVPVIAVAGNHDSPGRLSFGSTLYRKSGYHIAGQARAEIETVTLRDSFGPVHFHLIPYLHPAEIRALFEGEQARTFDEAYRVLLSRNLDRIDPAARNVAVAHGFFANLGGREGEILTSDSEVNIGGMDIADSACLSPFDYAALGHLHAPQRAGGEYIRYSGSPLKYSLSEQNQCKSYTVVELGEKGRIGISTLPCPFLRDVRTLRGSFENLLEPSLHTGKSFGDYVFAEIEGGCVLYPMEKLRKLFPHILGLRFLNQEGGAMPEVRHGREAARLTTEELFVRFFRDVKGYDIPEAHLALLREVLAESEREGAAAQ